MFYALKGRRFIAIAWFLIAYFSFFFIPVSTSESFVHILGLTGEAVPIDYARIQSACLFVFIFNLVFLVTELSLWKLFGVRTTNINTLWQLPKSSAVLNRVELFFAVFLVVGTILYGIQTLQFDYKDYVAVGNEASWSVVFLWASTPFITIAAMRKQYVRAFIACIPYLYFAYHMKIRSFALLSLIPLAIIYALQATTSAKPNILRLIRIAIIGGSLALILVMSSAVIMSNKMEAKGQGISLPDAGMPFGTVIMMELSDKFDTKTGFDSLALYGRNLIGPFTKLYTKLFDEKLELIEDPPFVMGRLYQGVPRSWSTRFHYPSLWYGDAYVSFGQAGLLLAALWAAIFIFLEVLMSSRMMLLALMLPFFSWHTYMLVRGATAIATVPYAYAAYIALIIGVLAGGVNILNRKFKIQNNRKLLKVNSPRPQP
jgi:hypothetical protein